MRRLRAPLAAKLLVPLVFLPAAVVGLLHVLWFSGLAEREGQEILRGESLHLELMATSLTPALLTGDLAQAYETLDSIRARRPDWKVLRLLGAKRNTIFPLGRSEPDDPRLTWITQSVSQSGEQLGTLMVGLRLDALVDAKLGPLRRFEMLLLLALAGASAIAAGMLEFSVRRPLQRLSAATTRIAQGDYGSALPAAARDEIGQFSRAFERMRETLRERESALEESRARLQAIIDNAVEAIITIDDHGTILSFNRAAERIFGYDAREALGRNVSLLMPEPYRSAHDGYLRAFAERGEPRAMGRLRELAGARKSGETFPILLAVDAVRWADEMLFVGAILDISERKRAEQEAVEARAAAEAASRQLITAIETLEDGFVLYDAEDRLVICNSRYREIYRTSADLLVPGMRFEEIIRTGVSRGQYPQARGREEQWIAERMRAHQTANSVIEQQIDNGRWLRIAERRTPEGGVVGFRVDITQLKQARVRAEAVSRIQSHFLADSDSPASFATLLRELLELTDSEYGLVAEVFEAAGRAPYLKTLAISDASWDEASHRIWEEGVQDGLEFHNLNSLLGAAIVSRDSVMSNDPASDSRSGGLPKGHPPIDCFLGIPLLAGDTLVGMIGLANRPGGYDESLPLELAPVLDTVRTLILSYRANRARRDAQEALRRSEAENRKLALVASRTSNAVIITDAAERIEWVNDAFTKITGYSLEEVKGRRPGRLLQGKDTDAATAALMRERIARGEGFGGVEVLNYAKDGRPYWIMLEVQPVLDEHGQVVQFLAIESDVTERKQAGERLRASLEEKEILLKEIHHRVKNNLLVASSLLEFQQDYTRDPAVARILTESRDRIRSMALIHEKLSRADSLDRIRLDEYLETLVGRLVAAHETHGQTLRLHLDLSPIMLSVDMATPCGLIVNELIANAFEHAFPNRGDGDLWIMARIQDGGRIEISVRDNGIGFPPDRDPASGESLGLQLVTLLTRQIEGSLHIERDNGTLARLTFAELGYKKRI